jgi:hypothetical protein
MLGNRSGGGEGLKKGMRKNEWRCGQYMAKKEIEVRN